MSPHLEAAYLALCQSGRVPTENEVHQLGNLAFRHPSRGRQPVVIDDTTLRQSSYVYAQAAVRNALQEYSVRTKSHVAMADFIARSFAHDDLIWGVSGFASAGYDCTTEGRGLAELYAYFGGAERPGLIVDGGVAQGVLGINGVLAAMHGIPTLGCIPLQGLASLGERTRTLVWGDTYEDREVLVGTIADVVACVAGGKGSARECLHALRHGSTVLLLSLREYEPGTFPRTYFQHDEVRKAITEGRFLVCDSINTIASKAQEAWESAMKFTRISRTRRSPALAKLLVTP